MQPSKHTQSPPFARYFKARLQPFTKPIFWGTSVVIVILGAGLVHYSRNPELLVPLIDSSNIAYPTNTKANLDDSKATNKTNQELSRDDLAIGSEIDNLDVLFKEFKQQNTAGLNPEATINSKGQGKNKKQTPEVENWLQSYLKQQKQKKSNPSTNLGENNVVNEPNLTKPNVMSSEALLESLNKIDYSQGVSSTNSQQQQATGNKLPYQSTLPSYSPLNPNKTENSALQNALNNLQPNNPQPQVNNFGNANNLLPQTKSNSLEVNPKPASNFNYSYTPNSTNTNNNTAQTPINSTSPNVPVFQPKIGQNSGIINNNNNISDRLFPQTNTQLGTTQNTSPYSNSNPLVTPQNQGLQPLQVPQNQLTPLLAPQQ